MKEGNSVRLLALHVHALPSRASTPSAQATQVSTRH
jgi:hypothetical protein